MDIHSEGVVPLGTVPDVVGLVGRRPDATGRRILRGRDVHSIHVLVPDARGLDHNLHDVTTSRNVFGRPSRCRVCIVVESSSVTCINM